MDSIEYLEKSGRTTAPTAPEDMSLTLGDVYALTDVIESGIEADKQKRIIFYKTDVHKADARAEEAFKLLETNVDKATAHFHSANNVEYKVDQKLMDLYHAILGIQSEVGEVAEQLLYSLIEGKSIDDVNIREENGDITWYVALALRAVGGTFGDTFARNIAKLAKRYPELFTLELAENRDLEAERKVLEE